MSLSRNDVERVAVLARLRLTNDELERMTLQLNQIVGYFEQLDELDTTDVEPFSHPLALKNVFRDDSPESSLPCEQALSNAPKQDRVFFLVPAVLE